MLRHNIIIAFRNILKQKGYSLINLLGLSIGICSSLLLFMYVQHELGYDRHHSKSKEIVRMVAMGMLNGNEFNGASVGAPAGPALKQDYPEVKEYVRFRSRGSYIVTIGDEHVREEKVIFADSSLFDVFDVPLLRGDQQTALHSPNQVIISQSTAQRYFGKEDAIGKRLILDQEDDFEVTGVFEDIPSQSHFHFDLILSMSSLEESRRSAWTSFNFQTYLLLENPDQWKAFEALMPDVIKKYVGPEILRFLGVEMDAFEKSGNRIGFFLQPLTDIHLSSDLEDEFEANGDRQSVYLMGLIALFILILACINFMNLATARASSRAREVGVKKAVGVKRGELIQQFLTESGLMSVFASILAVGLAILCLPLFNDLSAMEFTVSQVFSPTIIGCIVVIAIGTGLLAGSYPAFFLSSFQPVMVLKGSLHRGKKKNLLRGILVVFQFFIAALLLVSTLVVYQQLQFIQQKKLGFDKEHVLVLQDAYVMGDKINAFKQKMLSDARIQSASITGFIPIDGNSNSSSFWEGRTISPTQTQVIRNWWVDHDYIETMGMEVIEGRGFSRDYPTDSTAIVVNQATADFFGWENPIGGEVSTHRWDTDTEDDIITYHVIGVVENFHYSSFKNRIAPLLMYLGNNRSMISFRFMSDNPQELIEFAQKTWQEHAPGHPFNPSFLDDRFDKSFRAEQRLGKLFAVFAGLAILVACLGLFGLAAYSAEQRTKEIGIRKILGASLQQIVWSLSKEFAILVGIAMILVIPLSWFGLQRWLESFAYHTEMDVSVYVLTGIILLLVAAASVSLQAIRAALSEPIQALRYE